MVNFLGYYHFSLSLIQESMLMPCSMSVGISASSSCLRSIFLQSSSWWYSQTDIACKLGANSLSLTCNSSSPVKFPSESRSFLTTVLLVFMPPRAIARNLALTVALIVARPRAKTSDISVYSLFFSQMFEAKSLWHKQFPCQ